MRIDHDWIRCIRPCIRPRTVLNSMVHRPRSYPTHWGRSHGTGRRGSFYWILCRIQHTRQKRERERERRRGGISTVRISTSRSSSAATTGIQSSSSTIIQEQKQGLTRVRNECSSSIYNSTQLASCCSSGWRWRVRIVFMAADRCYPEGNGTTTGIFVTFPATGTERPQPLRSFP